MIHGMPERKTSTLLRSARTLLAAEMWGLMGSRSEIHASGYALC
jgi:hypothetical protein